MTTYTPYSVELIDDEFGTYRSEGVGTETEDFDKAFDEFVEDFMDDCNECGFIVRVNGKAHYRTYGEDFTVDENGDYQSIDYTPCDEPIDLEMGFNPYMGCYDYDC